MLFLQTDLKWLQKSFSRTECLTTEECICEHHSLK